MGRRRFADGGSTDDAPIYDTTQPIAPPYDTGQPAAAPSQSGALARGIAQPADQDTMQRIADLQNARQILAAGNSGGGMSAAQMLAGGPLASELPGATNLPLLAAAGALLRPTHTGTIGESLGGAFEAGAGALGQQRQLEENARLRAAQLADTAAWRQSMTGINQQKANTAGDVAAARIPLMQAQSGMDMARGFYYQAKASADAAGKPNEAEILRKTMDSLADGKTINPDTGQPWTPAEAYRYLKQADIRQENADTASRRADTAENLGQQRIDVSRASLQQRQDAFAEHKQEFEANQGRQITAAENQQLLKMYGLSKDPYGKTSMPMPTMRPFATPGDNAQPSAPGAAPAPATQAPADPLGIR